MTTITAILLISEISKLYMYFRYILLGLNIQSLVESLPSNHFRFMSGVIGSWKFNFRTQFGISVKFRFEWYITPYDSCLLYPHSPNFIYLHAYAIKIYRENIGKFEMNHMMLYIIRSGILRWFRIWSQNNIFAYAF